MFSNAFEKWVFCFLLVTLQRPRIAIRRYIAEEINTVENESFTASEQSFETDESNPSPSNGLENFDFDEETPELFNSDGSISETEEETSLSTETNTTKEEEDDLEIPAFLRRQKN